MIKCSSDFACFASIFFLLYKSDFKRNIHNWQSIVHGDKERCVGVQCTKGPCACLRLDVAIGATWEQLLIFVEERINCIDDLKGAVCIFDNALVISIMHCASKGAGAVMLWLSTSQDCAESKRVTRQLARQLKQSARPGPSFPLWWGWWWRYHTSYLLFVYHVFTHFL